MIHSPRVCVQVQSVYIESQSSPEEERYVFAYTVTIRNLGRSQVQLLGRYWLITNGHGRETEVQGEGVVGEQPHIPAGGEYQYTSGAVIETPLGTMQGHYEMIDIDGARSVLRSLFSVSQFQRSFIKTMSTYLIGDVHGCYDELIALLAQVEFDPRRDTLWLTGDLVARGPGSLEVLRYVKSLGDSVRLVLGNHDLHLLAVFAGISRNKPKDRLKPLLEAPDADELLNWLRRQPLLQVDEEKKLVMAHAGITPQWDLETAQQCARDVEAVLSSDSYPFFLDAMYGDMPNHWSNELSGLARLRFISNAFTRMRYCFPNGQLDMYSKEAPEDAPAPLKPWFAIPGPVSNAYSIAFGHWASLEGRGTPEGIYALDTGCCWGGELTCLRWEDKQYFTQPSNRQKSLDEGEAVAS
ncbi:Bis(5'-nucleosyl)-tetraphosphatase, symmetrical [Klebsiella pneumoniae IS46]|nr:Bis(5'-nucleosyl)-tetraphosphatase, symmetrical [Klebsiella pneumoniae IS43]CDL14893.1 Bis(5'-nucleosyl)-tetraphosphatase, symmetrical [Klebsiella pneumoniae IS46]